MGKFLMHTSVSTPKLYLSSFLGICLVFLSFIHHSSAQQTFKPNQPPAFVSGGDLSRFSLPEDTAVGTVVYRLKGTDPEDGELTYSISGEYFRVNKKTGDITLIKAVDRETENQLDVIISLTDDGHGLEPSTVSLRREIIVTDINDNGPRFHKRPYSFKVSERTHVGATVFADIPITDDDFGPNAHILLTCSNEETPVACQTFSVTAEKVGDGKYIGIISLAMPLDYETHSSYAMNLVASDGLNNATALIAVTVLDVQDQAPKFYSGPYLFKIKENSPPGTKVGEIAVQDGDIGNPRHLQIRLHDESENKYFRLTHIERDIYTGTYSAIIETTNYTLDAEDEFIRENLGVYELVLEAREIPLSPQDLEQTLLTRTGVAVMIEDVDDHLPNFIPPQFTRVLRVPYNINEGWTFPDFRVEVEDGDIEPHNSKFDLKFDWNIEDSPVPIEEVFAFVTPSNDYPTIQSKGMITMEVLNISLLQPGSMIDLQIGAFQKGYLVSSLNVPIEVAPGPKVRPVFNQTVYRVSVPEDIPENGLIARIAAKNHDDIEGIKYSLIGVGAEKFYVDEDTGEIRCGPKCLDYEKEKTHFFLVKAKAGDSVEDEVFALFYIDVLETNDNTPEFETAPGGGNNIRRAVPDGTSTFNPPFFVKAFDADLNDRIRYSVLDTTKNDSGIFIDPTTSELKLEKPLRWVEAGEHKLLITATDKTGKASYQNVVVVVQAVANLPPSFAYKTQQIEIPETLEQGELIVTVKAHDPDGQDAAIKYSIEYQPEQDMFVIEEGTGTLRLNGKLDYEEKQKLYTVNIRATDEGKIPETAETNIEIVIMDINDEKPVFTKKNYVGEMSESSMPDLVVLKLEATDSDQNAELEYGISCPCKVWDSAGSMGGNKQDAEDYIKNLRVDPSTGEIVLTDTFEYKKSAVFEFQASVQDTNGLTPQNDSAVVTIYVTAAERTLPIFGHPWTTGNPWINLTIPEDIEVGSTVVTLNAWDYIAGEPITLFQLIQSDSNNFHLEDNELKVVEALDFEENDMFMLAVKAIDVRGGESIANLAIAITDINDNYPIFSRSEYKGKVSENAMFPTPILTVAATDADDAASHGAIRYALTGPQSHLFTIDELAGVIQVAPGADIDREKDSSHNITVLALDTPAGGPFQKSATARVSITVLDINDNDPECKADEFLVPENAKSGTIFGNITCTDKDEFVKLTFHMRDDTNLNLFSIDPETGRLSVARSLRGRGRTAAYLVAIVVEDGKEPTRTVSLTIPIKVTNVIPNDGKPRFTNENTTATISESASRGTPVLMVKAEDTDSFDNGEGRLHFGLMKQVYPCHSKMTKEKVTKVEDVDFFRLDEQSGLLSLKESIDREKYDCFSVLVSVEDSGTPPQSDTQWFEIFVNDIDDSLPYLPKSIRILELNVNETTEKGAVVYKFNAEDKDVYPNNLVQFEITGGSSDIFQLVPSGERNASLVLNGVLSEMDPDDLTFVVKCHPKDKKISVPDCFSKVHVKVIRDPNHALSQLHGKNRQQEMILGVAAGTPVGNLIGNAGMSKNIKTSVQIFHPNSVSNSPYNVTEVFHIDEATGDIIVWDNLEKYQNGHLRVTMIDQNGGMKKNLKVFIAPNDQLLSADMLEYSKLQRWIDEADLLMNAPDQKQTGIKKGIFRILTFDESNAAEGKTKVCFQLLENENMVSQEKALQLLDNGELQDIFLKFSFEDIQKGCPQRIRAPARLSLTASTSRFWVERSLLGIASVVAIATISAILILCLVNRNRGKDEN